MSRRYITQDEYSHLTEAERVAISRLLREENRDVYERLDNPIILKHTIYRDYVKRVLDILLSFIALVLTIPFNLFLFVVTIFDVGFPVFYHQNRIGRNGKVFDLVKFRNMTNEVNEHETLLLPEQRITKWGRFARRTSMDELLNFWNILKGDMSIIGPRPLPDKYYPRFTRKYNQRHLVKPGLECPIIISSTSDNGWQRRFDNDLWYVEHISFRTDFKMCMLLVKKVFSKEERKRSANGLHGEFLGFDRNENVVNSYCVKENTVERVIKRDHAIQKSVKISNFLSSTNDPCTSESISYVGNKVSTLYVINDDLGSMS